MALACAAVAVGVVRGLSGGAAGAAYVFFTDGARDGQLRAVYRAQKLRRASSRVQDGVLFHRSAPTPPATSSAAPRG